MNTRSCTSKRATKAALEKALKERLNLLTEGLCGAEIAAKGIELVKEIKELHALLTALRPTPQVHSADARIMVVWDTEGIKKDASHGVALTAHEQQEQKHKGSAGEQE